MLGLFDYATHTIIDYSKHRVMKHYDIAKNGKIFWSLQTLIKTHYTVYFIMVSIIGMNI